MASVMAVKASSMLVAVAERSAFSSGEQVTLATAAMSSAMVLIMEAAGFWLMADTSSLLKAMTAAHVVGTALAVLARRLELRLVTLALAFVTAAEFSVRDLSLLLIAFSSCSQA